MAFVLRPNRRFPVQCPVSYSSGPFNSVGTVCNLSLTGWRLSGDLAMKLGSDLVLCIARASSILDVTEKYKNEMSQGPANWPAENRKGSEQCC